MTMQYDEQECYRAHLSRDPRFDGKFFVAVKTTQIYCRPVCPARKAKLKNLEFFMHAVQAEEAGYRACLRCRPETAPGSPAWRGTSTTVQRAVRMMDALAGEAISIHEIALSLGVGERWLRKLFQERVGINPQTLLLNKKLDVAKNLLEHTSLSMTDIAISSGFNSSRRFNDAFKKRFQETPSHFKNTKKLGSRQCLHLRYRPPLSWTKLLDYYKYRAIPSVERVDGVCYQRLVMYGDRQGFISVSPIDEHMLQVDYQFNEQVDILNLVARIKDMFDLEADPEKIESDLKRDRKLAPIIDAYGGLRIPGCWDGFELAVRAIIGQKISVKAARTILIRLVERCGALQTLNTTSALTHCFPTPENIMQADLSAIGLTQGKIQCIKALAALMHDRTLTLDGTADYTDTCNKLLSIKGIGPWTVQYIAMRTLRNPDAFPDTDLELKKRIAAFKLDPNKWKPWRAYAAILLFNMGA